MPFGWFRRGKKVEKKKVERPKPTEHRDLAAFVRQPQITEEGKASQLTDLLMRLHEHDWKKESLFESGRHYFVVPYSSEHHHFIEVIPEPNSMALKVRVTRISPETSIKDAIEKLRKIADQYYGFEFDARHSQDPEKREIARGALEKISKIFREERIEIPKNATVDDLTVLLRAVALRLGRP